MIHTLPAGCLVRHLPTSASLETNGFAQFSIPFSWRKHSQQHLFNQTLDSFQRFCLHWVTGDREDECQARQNQLQQLADEDSVAMPPMNLLPDSCHHHEPIRTRQLLAYSSDGRWSFADLPLPSPCSKTEEGPSQAGLQMRSYLRLARPFITARREWASQRLRCDNLMESAAHELWILRAAGTAPQSLPMF